MARRRLIEADFADAVKRFGGRGGQVDSFELGDEGDDSISLELGGVSYTLLIVDAYPSGLCQVFGDDSEFNLPGTISEVVEQLIERQRPRAATPAGSAGELGDGDSDEAEMEQPLAGGSSDDDDFDIELEEPYLVGTGPRAAAVAVATRSCPPDPRLEGVRADVLEAKLRYGEEAVELSDLGDSLRLLLHIDASAGGSIDAITAGAWGIDLAKPITVRMVLNAGDHAAGAVPSLQVYQGRSPAESSLEPEKQLAAILTGFLKDRSTRPESPPKRLRLSSPAAARPSSCSSSCSSVPVAAACSADDAVAGAPSDAPATTAAAAGGSAAAEAGMAAEDADTGLMWDEAAGSRHVEELRRRKARDVEAVLSESSGIATQLLGYAARRLPTLHEHCAICDEPHMQPPMLQRTVCGREFCCWQFAQFGRLISDAEGLNTTSEVTDLLVCMAIHAAGSERRELIFDPFPTLFAKDGSRPALSADRPDSMKELIALMTAVRTAREEAPSGIGAAWLADAERLQRHGELVRPMLQWIVRSARCLLLPLQPEQCIPELGTELQYLLVSAAPEREAAFQELKRKHGSTFAFHGSPPENWHSILRNGLRNASHTKLMISGASYGSGIYLSPKSRVSAGYSRGGLAKPAKDDTPRDRLGRCRPPFSQPTGNRKPDYASLKMLAVCEVAKLSTLRVHGHVWVAPTEEMVVTRFLMVYSDTLIPELSLDQGGLERRLHARAMAWSRAPRSTSGGSS